VITEVAVVITEAVVVKEEGEAKVAAEEEEIN
jgi:hypothetical protein